jgi:hypothetical protein
MMESPTLSRHLDQLSAVSDGIWLVGMATGLSLTIVAAFAPLPPGGGTMCAYLGHLVRSDPIIACADAYFRKPRLGIRRRAVAPR